MKTKIIIGLSIIIAIFFIGFAYEEKTKIPFQEQNIIYENEETNEARARNFLKALQGNAYDKISSLSTEQLTSELTEEKSQELKELLDQTWGEMIDLGEPEYPDFGEDKIVLDYRNSQFEKEPGSILIRFIFNEENKLAQIYFDSPKLKEAVNNID